MTVNHRATDQRPSKVLVYAAVAFLAGMFGIGIAVVLMLH